MASVTDVLSRHGIQLAEAALAGAVEQAFQFVVPDSAALADADVAVLRSVGARFDDEQAPARAVSRAVGTFTALIASSLSVRDAAARLGVDPSRIRHRVGDRSLYAVKAGPRGSLRLPAFQFVESGPLPGLATVLRALPAGRHPLAVWGFFSTPQPELELAGAAVPPRDWLSLGGDPDVVARLAAAQF
jgi:hypothetical protein